MKLPGRASQPAISCFVVIGPGDGCWQEFMRDSSLPAGADTMVGNWSPIAGLRIKSAKLSLHSIDLRQCGVFPKQGDAGQPAARILENIIVEASAGGAGSQRVRPGAVLYCTLHGFGRAGVTFGLFPSTLLSAPGSMPPLPWPQKFVDKRRAIRLFSGPKVDASTQQCACSSVG